MMIVNQPFNHGHTNAWGPPSFKLPIKRRELKQATVLLPDSPLTTSREQALRLGSLTISREQALESVFHSDKEQEDMIDNPPSESERLLQWLETADPNTMQHFRDKTAALEEICSTLQPAGLLLFSVLELILAGWHDMEENERKAV